MRTNINFNSDWNFYKGENYENAVWEQISLPHTWNALDGQDGGNDYYQGIAWYEKSFRKESGCKEIFIRFGAVNKLAQVWCNGTFVGEHRGGFSAFTFDLTPYAADGENQIRVMADNSNDLPIYPRQADFTFFGGMYRGAELITYGDRTHIDVCSMGTDAILVTPKVTGGDGEVTVDVNVTGACQVAVTLTDAEGNCVAEGTAMQDGAGKAQCQMFIPNINLWNGVENPYLYHAKVTLTDAAEDGAMLDQAEVAFGFRTCSVDAAAGFSMNEKSYPLHGVCRHQDRENMGWAITEKEHDEDMALIQEIGANTIRLAHYQQAEYFYDLCDKKGMVVWAEIPFISVYDNRREADENLRVQMRELILQNYNHPSICFWGVANEVGIANESEELYAMVKELHEMAKKLDPSRLTAIANVGVTKTSSPLFHITDLTSYNEYMGWYEKTADDHGNFCDERHGQIPEIPLAISEYGAEAVMKWHSASPKCKDYTEEYQAIVHEKAMSDFDNRPYLYATWLWNMFDFAADARDEGGCKGRNNKGLVTYDRKVKKQAFYYYKACWSKEPFVYICGERFTKRYEDVIEVKIYSNQPAVDLWVNGTHVGHQTGDTVFIFPEVYLSQPMNELAAKTAGGQECRLTIEHTAEPVKEYVFKEEKNLNENVTQWFAGLVGAEDASGKELDIREGYLSVADSMEVIYHYPEGYQIMQDLVAKPMSFVNPGMADRLKSGGAMSFSSIWNHVKNFFPDELILVVNERLNKIPKNEEDL